jgi:hypothetical protein
MQFAVHITCLEQTRIIPKIFSHLEAFYEPGAMQGRDWPDLMAANSVRIYVGDEFCIHRLPHIDELDAVCRSANAISGGLTFLTPPLTDEGMEKCAAAFDYFKENAPQAEVVVNDWGVLVFLQQHYPLFRLSLGRLLNRGFKDPRLRNPEEASRFSAETAELFNTCTFDVKEFAEKMQELKVKRLERDLLPYGDAEIPNHDGLESSVYFPFGYVSTGRLCWMASFNASAARKYSISDGCRQPCNTMSLKLNRAGTNLQLFQAGNTIFYLYAPSKLAALVKQAKAQNLRLVYQGLMV